MAGSGREKLRGQIVQWAGAIGLAEEFILVPDVALLVAGASSDGTGIALVAGTGSIAWGIDCQGRVARAGGWGYFLGDEGSGYWVGRQALGAVVRAADGRDQATALTEAVLAKLGLSCPEDLRDWVPELVAKPSLVAQLAPLVFRCADAGDVISERILQTAIEALAELTITVARKLFGPTEVWRIALAGSVLQHEPAFRQRIIGRVAELLGSPVEPVLVEPLQGAARLAEEVLARRRWMHWQAAFPPVVVQRPGVR